MEALFTESWACLRKQTREWWSIQGLATARRDKLCYYSPLKTEIVGEGPPSITSGHKRSIASISPTARQGGNEGKRGPHLSSPVPQALISTSDWPKNKVMHTTEASLPEHGAKNKWEKDLDHMESNQLKCMHYKHMGNDVGKTQKSHHMDNFYQHIYVMNHPVLEYTVNMEWSNSQAQENLSNKKEIIWDPYSP